MLADDDMLVDVVTMHHGKKSQVAPPRPSRAFATSRGPDGWVVRSQDPVRKMNFFGKTAAETGVWTAEAMDPRIYESATPAVWQSHEIRVLVRNKDKIEVWRVDVFPLVACAVVVRSLPWGCRVVAS